MLENTKTIRIGILWNRLEDCKNIEDNSVNFFQYCGENSGNLAYLEGVCRLLGGEYTHVPWHASSSFVNENFDLLVLPAANQLGAHAELSSLVEEWSKFSPPILTLGLGIQNSSNNEIKLTDGTKQWLGLLVDSSTRHGNPIGVRGDVTRDFIRELYPNAHLEVIGCPSLFLSKEIESLGPTLQQNKTRSLSRILANAPDLSWLNTKKLHLEYLREISKCDGGYILQAPKNYFNIAIMSGQLASEFELQVFRDLLNESEACITAEDFFSRHMRAFTSIRDWGNYCSTFDYCVGFRIHGFLVATYSGIPSFLNTVDTRTLELSKTLSLPCAPLEDGLDLASIKTKIKNYDYQEMVDGWNILIKKMELIVKKAISNLQM